MIKWDNSDYLIHYGIKGRSGRYPAGSGENPKTGLRKKKTYQQGVDRKGNTFTKKELDAMRIPSPKSYGSASKKYEKTVKVAPAGFLRRQMQMEVAGIKGTSNYYKQNAKRSNNLLMKSIYDLAGAGYGAEARISAALNKKLFNIDQKQIDKGKQILVDNKLYKKVLSEKKNKKKALRKELISDISNQTGLDKQTSKKIAKYLKTNDTVHYINPTTGKYSVISKTSKQNSRNESSNSRTIPKNANQNVRKSIEKAYNNFDKDFKGKTPSIKTVAKKYNIDEETAIDILEEKRYH